MSADVRAVVKCDNCQTPVIGPADMSVLALRRALREVGGWGNWRGASGRFYDFCGTCAESRGLRHADATDPERVMAPVAELYGRAQLDVLRGGRDATPGGQ